MVSILTIRGGLTCAHESLYKYNVLIGLDVTVNDINH